MPAKRYIHITLAALLGLMVFLNVHFRARNGKLSRENEKLILLNDSLASENRVSQKRLELLREKQEARWQPAKKQADLYQ